ncbi:MAG TPA: YceI family protein [Longimicrobiaceae bacterium]|nr:YceI family protein [Longimicrobiaceae bacterium]
MRNARLLAPLLLALGLAPAPAPAQAALGGAELYPIDRWHSNVEFTVRFMGLSRVRGRFNDFSGAVVFDPRDPARSSVTAVIRTASVDTDVSQRDEHLRSPDFFDAEKFPRITFQSTSVRRAADGFVARGPLTIRGVTREVEIPFAVLSPRAISDGWGNRRVAFEGRVRLNRKDFGVVGNNFWNQTIDLTSLAVADEVEVTLSIQARVMNMERITWDARAKPSIGEVLDAAVQAQGVEAALRRYRELRSTQPEAYNFAAGELNKLGYRLVQRGRPADAVRIFALVAQEHPDDWNAHDSLGEAYAHAGDRERALRAYERALALNPYAPSALEMLRRLRGTPGALTLH